MEKNTLLNGSFSPLCQKFIRKNLKIYFFRYFSQPNEGV